MATKTNGSDISSVVDLSKLSLKEIEQVLANKKLEQARVAKEKGKEARAACEKWLHEKYGLSLAQVWMANAKEGAGPQTYQKPGTDETYTYSGRGKVPGWLKGSDGKPNKSYLVS